MRLFYIIFLALNFVSIVSFSQTPKEPVRYIEVFKEKLQVYYEKHDMSTNITMHVVPLDSTRQNMPIVSVESYMIDKELGLAYEFATQKIFDTETNLVYLIDEKKIYDSKTNTFYYYNLSPKQ